MQNTTAVNAPEKKMHFVGWNRWNLFCSTCGIGSAIFSGLLGEVRETRWLLPAGGTSGNLLNEPKNGVEGPITRFPHQLLHVRSVLRTFICFMQPLGTTIWKLCWELNPPPARNRPALSYLWSATGGRLGLRETWPWNSSSWTQFHSH